MNDSFLSADAHAAWRAWLDRAIRVDHGVHTAGIHYRYIQLCVFS